MFRPTKSGRIGSSRWPRSTITASRTRAGRPNSNSASSAAFIVLPVKRTSSTRTTVQPSMSWGNSLGRTCGTVPRFRKSSRNRATSRLPTGTRLPSKAFNLGGQAARERDSSGEESGKHQTVRAAVVFDDFVSQSANSAIELFGVHHLVAHRSTPRVAGAGVCKLVLLPDIRPPALSVSQDRLKGVSRTYLRIRSGATELPRILELSDYNRTGAPLRWRPLSTWCRR